MKHVHLLMLPARRRLTYAVKAGRRAGISSEPVDRDTGRVLFGVLTEIAKECAGFRATYGPERAVLSLDFGVSILLAEGDGALLAESGPCRPPLPT